MPMSKARTTLALVVAGMSDANISFGDLCHLVERCGFTLEWRRETGRICGGFKAVNRIVLAVDVPRHR
jgi:hypothetical protein